MTIKLNQKFIPILATIGVFLAMYLFTGIRFPNFLTFQVLINFFLDNACLGIIAVGMTFVILSGGIDLSVGSMIAFSGVLMASLIEHAGFPPLLAILIVLACGSLMGLIMGAIIQFFEAPAFIVTLGGLFLARGIGQVISLESIPITNPMVLNFISFGIPLPGDMNLPSVAIIFIVVFLVGLYIAHYTRFGRAVYAVGGNAQSASLMGLPVARTKVLVYTLSGFCSSLGGIVYTLYTSAGYGLAGVGFEMDVIAAVVIGGTLITGGVGLMVGTLFGVMIQGVIQTYIMFDGTLNSFLTRIFIGGLMLVFILFQQLLSHLPVRANEAEVASTDADPPLTKDSA